MTTPSLPVPGRVASLQPFVDAGVFGWADVHLADAVARLQPDVDHPVLLAVAVASRAPRLGHVGIELAAVAERLGLTDGSDPTTVGDGGELPWPGLGAWADALLDSPAVAAPTRHSPNRSVRSCGTVDASTSSATGSTSWRWPAICCAAPGSAPTNGIPPRSRARPAVPAERRR